MSLASGGQSPPDPLIFKYVFMFTFFYIGESRIHIHDPYIYIIFSLIWHFIEQMFPFKLSFKNVTSFWGADHPFHQYLFMYTALFALKDAAYVHKILTSTRYYSLTYITILCSHSLMYATHFI